MLENVILPAKLKKELIDSINQIKQTDKIYNEWGFKDIDGTPKVVLNFYGPSGTGKTLAATEIAKLFKAELLVATPANIKSKFVGDSEKSIVGLFDEAREKGAVLFFDEADTLLTARKETEHGADRSHNSMITTLLTELENHRGVVIFATNFLKSYDLAFEARILKHLKFPLPSLEAKIDIISKMLPEKAPLEIGFRKEDNLLELALLCKDFSGRHIKNAALELLTQAAIRGEEIITKELALEVFTNAKDSFTKYHKEIK